MIHKRKCPNCNMGNVDGGFENRIKRELEVLEKEKDNKLRNIQDKDKKKRIAKEQEVKKEMDVKIDAKTNEECRRVSRCGYCKGSAQLQIEV